MSTVTWERIGPREKEVLAVLREGDGPLTVREVLTALRADGDEVAYTTIGTVLDRLVEKGLVSRDREVHAGSPRHRYRFDPERHRERLVEGVVDDVAMVLGRPGLELLEQRAATTTPTTPMEQS